MSLYQSGEDKEEHPTEASDVGPRLPCYDDQCCRFVILTVFFLSLLLHPIHILSQLTFSSFLYPPH